ncbi:MAG: hypothetical protein JXR22_03415 [Prolixibacteraceae bacterium]|nr:hypothetical protein [Prolixibacteraceae bacterium]
MKPISILFLIITLSTGLCFAQGIVVEDRIWSEAIFGSEGNSISTTHYKFCGDTIVNHKTYKHVCVSWSLNSNKWQHFNDMIREDSLRVYKANIKGKETLIYDFNLKKGENFFDEKLDEAFVVDSVVFREIQGNKLKHIYLSLQASLFMVWIEEIGSYHGVFNRYDNSGGDVVLLCVEEHGEMLYINEQFDTCELNGTYTNNRELPLLELTVKCIQNNLVMVQNRSNTTGLITFYDLKGKLVLKESVETGTTQLCLPNSGLFIYRFQRENGQSQSGKIVIL